jgi:hypothetical protein
VRYRVEDHWSYRDKPDVGWWDFGVVVLEIRLAGKGSLRNRTSDNEGTCDALTLVRFAMLRNFLVLTTPVSIDMANRLSASKYNSRV